MNTSQSNVPSRLDPSLMARAQPWLWWTVLAVVGLAMVVFGSLGASREQNSVARTAMVVAQMQATVQSLSAESMLAAQGNAGAIDSLRSSREQVGTLRGLLRTGGYAASSDPAPVLMLDGRSGFPVSQVDQALVEFDSRVRALEESASQLRLAAEAEDSLSSSLERISQSLSQVERLSNLTSGQWGQPLSPIRTLLSRPEMRTMRVIFSPLEGAETLQNSWAQQFQATSQELARINESAQSAGNLSTTEKTHLRNLTQAVMSLAEATSVLARTQVVRINAQKLQAPIQQSVEAIQRPLGEVGTRVLAMQSSRPLGVYVSWAGALAVLAGLVGLIRATSSLSSQQWLSTQETRSGQGLAMVLDRLGRKLRRALSEPDGAPIPRLEEDPDSEAFTLVSLINALLERGEKAQSRGLSVLDSISGTITDASAPAGKAVSGGQRLHENGQGVSALARSMAQELARISQNSNAMRAHEMVEMTTSAELVMQEGAFRMDALRETVQSTSKRLKRLAEGAQSIATATTIIDEISRRVKVLSTNAAIEAAAHGEDGRKFAVLAKEIERLSQSAHEAAGDIGQVVKTIQVDAQETVEGMEKSTSEVVASTELATRAGQALREIEHKFSEFAKDLDSSTKEVEKQALTGVRVSQGCDAIASQAKDLVAAAEEIVAGVDRARLQIRNAREGIAPS